MITEQPDVKEMGKVYANESAGIYIMCTGKGKTEDTFSGTVIHQNGVPTDHRQGRYSDDWVRKTFHETTLVLQITNLNWKPFKEIGASNENN